MIEQTSVLTFPFQQEPLRDDIIRCMRETACHGSSVRELASLVQRQLGLGEVAVLPVLWYFMKAFCLPLDEVLPIREWIGTSNDTEIDALIMPRLEQSKESWTAQPESAGNVDTRHH